MKRPVSQNIRLSRQSETPKLVLEVIVREETDAEAYSRIVRETGERFRLNVQRIMRRQRRIDHIDRVIGSS